MKIANIHRFCVGALLLAGSLALAQTATVTMGSASPSSGPMSAACCQLTTSLASEVIRPQDIPGDEQFFLTEGAPPNIHFLIDTSGSMQEFPQVIRSDHDAFMQKGDTNALDPAQTGCGNTDLLSVESSRSWDYTKVYPVPDTGTGFGSDKGHPDLFKDDKVYAYMTWGDSNNPQTAWDTQDKACQFEYPLYGSSQATQYSNCMKCLQEKGFFKKPGINNYGSFDLFNSSPNTVSSIGTILGNAGKSRFAGWDSSGNPVYIVETRPYFIFTGRFLNFNPPKYVTAKVVMKQVIADMKRVRAGMSQFYNDSDDSKDGAALIRGQNPSCDQIIKDSSSFDSNRGSYIDQVDSLTFRTGTPLAKALMHIGEYFSSSDDVYKTKFGFSDFNYKKEFQNASLTSQGRSFCWGCQVSSVIVITDGDPSDNDKLPKTTWAQIQKLNGSKLVTCPVASDCQYSDKSDYELDDVAKMLANQDLQQSSPVTVGDLNTAGKQSLSIYTIGFGIDSKILKNVADVGNGVYYTASDAKTLKDSILSIIQAVQTRATSFSSTAVASLQIKNESGTLIPRFKPSKTVVNPWQGFLYRFNRVPEVYAGCVKDPKTGKTNSGDLNMDGDCEDVVMVDKDTKAVIEDDNGEFVHLDDPNVLAKPFWEAGEIMRPAAAVNPQTWKTREIWTIIDENGDGKIDANDTPVAFTEANATKLQDYLGISNNSLECETLRVQLSMASLTPLECAKLVIRYYRGADVLNGDPALRDYDRPFLLNDIFHSSPVSVEPPTPKFFCGYSNQCLNSLFSGRTVRNTYGTGASQRDAYDEFVAQYGNRDKIVLVGSNGGMLHAFKDSVVDKLDPLTGLYEYKTDSESGKELWAFIPPDLLPKLRMKLGKHGYFVDGTAMVRDSWLDGYGPKTGIKDVEDYRTVAVMGTGSGGVHRFALDLTKLIASPNVSGQKSHRPPNQKGDFLWMWPQPCDALALQLGESFSNFAPKPPPIGPVAMEDSSGPWTFSTSASGPVTQAREQWVVMLNGGYDPYMVRGRGLAMVDLKSGETLWSFFYGDGKQYSSSLRYPIPAGVAMMDLGNALNSSGDADLLFDTATIPDFGGQVWTVRFWLPGHRTGTNQVDNWYAARAFHVAQDSAQKGDDTIVRPGFSYITTNTIQPDTGYVRTYVGTGDRYHLVDYGTVCSLSNPRACAMQGCHIKENITIERNSVKSAELFTEFEGAKVKNTTASTLSTGDACLAPKVTLKWEYGKGGSCTADSNGSVEYTCSGSSTSWACATTKNDWANINSSTAPPAKSINRFYGFWSYGVDPTRRFNAGTEAIKYDDARVRDTDLIDVGQFDSTGAVQTAQSEAGSLSKGWYINYVPGAERTATAGTVIDGCVIWNSMEPSGATSAVCSTTGTNTARIYQANFVTGKADCAAGFNRSGVTSRFIASGTVAAPPEPAPMRTLINGKVSTGVIIPGVGGGGGSGSQEFTVSENKEVLQSIYQLELDKAGHDCRHGGTNCK